MLYLSQGLLAAYGSDGGSSATPDRTASLFVLFGTPSVLVTDDERSILRR